MLKLSPKEAKKISVCHLPGRIVCGSWRLYIIYGAWGLYADHDNFKLQSLEMLTHLKKLQSHYIGNRSRDYRKGNVSCHLFVL